MDAVESGRNATFKSSLPSLESERKLSPVDPEPSFGSSSPTD